MGSVSVLHPVRGLEMNGKKGDLLSLNQQSGRWAVKLEGFDHPVELMEANLRLAEGQ